MNAAKYFLLFTFALCGTGWGQLTWDARELEFHPSPLDTTVVAEFHFANTGNTSVKITDITTSCGCTTAASEKKVYAPGEKGKITVNFDISGRTGEQKETITVATSDPKQPNVVLQFKATIPKLLDIDNTWLTWAQGQALQPKIVNIKVAGDYPIHRLTITSTSPNMVTEVRHEEGSRDFQLVVTPKQANGEFVILEIKPDYPKDPPKYFHVYARADK